MSTENVGITRDELWPFYNIDDEFGVDTWVTVPSETATRWRSVITEFWRVQHELRNLFDVEE